MKAGREEGREGGESKKEEIQYESDRRRAEDRCDTRRFREVDTDPRILWTIEEIISFWTCPPKLDVPQPKSMQASQ
jgi:hypothetical protein